MHEKREFHLTFPELPSGESEDSVRLLLGNYNGLSPHIEIYGQNGVLAYDFGKFHIDGMEMHCVV